MALGADYKPGDLVFTGLPSFRRRIFAAIRAAGVERWEKLFTNLRSSCITDMVEHKYSEKFLDAMFGNSAMVRSRYYIQFRKDSEYARALEENEVLRKISVESDAGIDIDSMPKEVLLVLRDLLVNRFGSGKQVG